jgi:vesicle-fusing ATPase
MSDFNLALNEVKPQFGVDSDGLENSLRGGIIDYGQRFRNIYEDCIALNNQIKNSENTPLLSFLLEGRIGKALSVNLKVVEKLQLLPNWL